MSKNWGILIIIVILLIIVWFWVTSDRVTTPIVIDDQLTLEERVEVAEPEAGEVVSSPLEVRGEAPGNWFFEASFPTRLFDEAGSELAVAVAQAQAEWMTTEQVPFLATLTFTAPLADTGTLVLERDNPSGLPEHDAQVRIPIRFR